MPSGGKREGAGRKPATTPTKTARLAVRVLPQDTDTLRQYNQSETVRLLADGLRLGAGNLPELTAGEAECLRAMLSGSVIDALVIRHLGDEVAASEHPAAPSLLAKLRQPQMGDWELLALVMRHAT